MTTPAQRLEAVQDHRYEAIEMAARRAYVAACPADGDGTGPEEHRVWQAYLTVCREARQLCYGRQ